MLLANARRGCQKLIALVLTTRAVLARQDGALSSLCRARLSSPAGFRSLRILVGTEKPSSDLHIVSQVNQSIGSCICTSRKGDIIAERAAMLKPRTSSRLKLKAQEKARQEEGKSQQQFQENQCQNLALEDIHAPAGEALLSALPKHKMTSNRRTTRTTSGR